MFSPHERIASHVVSSRNSHTLTHSLTDSHTHTLTLTHCIVDMRMTTMIAKLTSSTPAH